MSVIYGAVLVPNPGDPFRLLQDAEFGMRAPLVYESAAKGREGVWKPKLSRSRFCQQDVGVPLVWNRTICGHAVDWIERLTNKQMPASGVAWALVGRPVIGTPEQKEAAEQYRLSVQGEYLEGAKRFGTLVLLGVNYKVLIQEQA